MPRTDSEPLAMTAAEQAAAYYWRRDLLDALCGASSPWTDLDSEGIPAASRGSCLEHAETGRV